MTRTALKQINENNEILVSTRHVSLCLLVNQRLRAMRIIDFRSGPHPTKRDAVMDAAREHGIERAYTLVERDECSTWTKLGFTREGNIPGFYKRSDAFILSSPVYPTRPQALEESGVYVTPKRDTSDTDKYYQAARRAAKRRAGEARPQVKVQRAKPADVEKALAAAVRAGRALTRFEPFGRDVERLYFTCTARGGFSLLISVETQPCFDNAFIELLTAPRTDKEVQLTSVAVDKLCEELTAMGLVGSFVMAAVEDTELGSIFIEQNFRRVGVLRNHLLIAGKRLDAFLWSRKLAQPDEG